MHIHKGKSFECMLRSISFFLFVDSVTHSAWWFCESEPKSVPSASQCLNRYWSPDKKCLHPQNTQYSYWFLYTSQHNKKYAIWIFRVFVLCLSLFYHAHLRISLAFSHAWICWSHLCCWCCWCCVYTAYPIRMHRQAKAVSFSFLSPYAHSTPNKIRLRSNMKMLVCHTAEAKHQRYTNTRTQAYTLWTSVNTHSYSNNRRAVCC